jgi:hypothetical protein
MTDAVLGCQRFDSNNYSDNTWCCLVQRLVTTPKQMTLDAPKLLLSPPSISDNRLTIPRSNWTGNDDSP